MIAADVLACIRRTFDAKEYVVLANVRNQTGFSRQQRYADALAISLWPSKGIELHGFEIKVSRSDWLSELKQPEKSHEIGRFCHRWWVAAPAGVVKAEEVPQMWGYLEVGEKRSVKKVSAPLRTVEQWSATFVASVFRSFGEDTISKAEAEQMAQERAKQYEADALAAGQVKVDLSIAESRLKSRERDFALYRERVEAFEQASGISFSQGYTWDQGRIGAVVKALLNDGAHIAHDEHAASAAAKFYTELAEQLKTLRERAKGKDAA